jgi:hypothetical protein
MTVVIVVIGVAERSVASAVVRAAKPFYLVRCHARLLPGMTRAALLLSLVLLGCEVSRDLRPELFACDAGGLCGRTDSGVTVVNCPVGGTCNCQEGRECAFRCTGDCTVNCLTGSSCDVDCLVARCVTLCDEGAACNITCTTADCDTTCSDSSSCTIDCQPTSQCTCMGPSCPF